jgi:PPK2 family polyphosphate:nucleotide phosphotransferase
MARKNRDWLDGSADTQGFARVYTTSRGKIMILPHLIDLIKLKPGKKVRLNDFDTGWAQSKELKEYGKEAVKERAKEILDKSLENLAEAQELLYADGRYSLLIVLQAMDAAGKDGTIKHVMSGVNPQGCQVFSFKKPSAEELNHNFLWRYMKSLPERGRIGIFNRSYYEDVLVVKVHPEMLDQQKLPPGKHGKSFWEGRYEDISAFEKHLVRSGVVVLKFFLNVSKEEQKRRFLERLNRSEKHWKFSPSDMKERAYWADYQAAYEDALAATTTEEAPWYVVPADNKWATRAVVADVITSAIQSLDLKFPVVTEEMHRLLLEARTQLEKE